VTFGTVPALEVGWITSTLIYAVTPQTAPEVVSVTVANHDDNGVAIPGETVTAANAFTFERPNIRLDVVMHRLIAQLVRMLRNQVFGNLDYKAPHMDYRRSDTATTNLRVPNLTLAGPAMVPNAFYTQHGEEHIAVDDETFMTRKRGTRYDLEFQIDGATDSKHELLGLRNSLLTFFRNNSYVTIARDTANPSAGTASYELLMGDEGIRDTSILSVSSISTFTMSCMIRAFEVETVGGFTDDAIVYRGSVADTLEFGNATPIT
jgi:hypothetical protein